MGGGGEGGVVHSPFDIYFIMKTAVMCWDEVDNLDR